MTQNEGPWNSKPQKKKKKNVKKKKKGVHHVFWKYKTKSGPRHGSGGCNVDEKFGKRGAVRKKLA